MRVCLGSRCIRWKNYQTNPFVRKNSNMWTLTVNSLHPKIPNFYFHSSFLSSLKLDQNSKRRLVLLRLSKWRYGLNVKLTVKYISAVVVLLHFHRLLKCLHPWPINRIQTDLYPSITTLGKSKNKNIFVEATLRFRKQQPKVWIRNHECLPLLHCC